MVNSITKLLYQINEVWSGSSPERKPVGYPITGTKEGPSGLIEKIEPIQFKPKDWIFEKPEITFRDTTLTIPVNSYATLNNEVLTVKANGYKYVLRPS